MRIETIQITKRCYIYTLTLKFKDLTITENEIEFGGDYYGEVSLEIYKDRIKTCIDILKKQIEEYGEITLLDFKDAINKYLTLFKSSKLKFDYSVDLKETTNDISDITIKLE